MPPTPARRNNSKSMRKARLAAGNAWKTSWKILNGLKHAELYKAIAEKPQDAVKALHARITRLIHASGEKSFEKARKIILAEVESELHALKARIKEAEKAGNARQFQRLVWDLKLAIQEIERKGKSPP